MARAHLRLIDTSPERPINPADVHSPAARAYELYRPRKFIEPALSAEACLTLTDHQLDAAADLVSTFVDHGARLPEAYYAFHFALLRPVLTWWDIQILLPVWQDCTNLCATSRGGPPTLAYIQNVVHECEDLLAAYRSGNPETVRATRLNALQTKEATFQPPQAAQHPEQATQHPEQATQHPAQAAQQIMAKPNGTRTSEAERQQDKRRRSRERR